jgi:hypothetical protein
MVATAPSHSGNFSTGLQWRTYPDPTLVALPQRT